MIAAPMDQREPDDWHGYSASRCPRPGCTLTAGHTAGHFPAPACTCPDDDKRACPVHDLDGPPPCDACRCLITAHTSDCPWVGGEMAVDMEAAFPELVADRLAERIVAWVLARVDAEMSDLREAGAR